MCRRAEGILPLFAAALLAVSCGVLPLALGNPQPPTESSAPAERPLPPSTDGAQVGSAATSSPAASTPVGEPSPAFDRENAIRLYPAGTPIQIAQIDMKDSSTGWALGRSEGESDHVLRTDDGGNTWWDVTPPEPAPAAGQALSAEAYFLDDTRAWVGYEPYEVVWRTTDAGITWSPARVPSAAPLGSTIWFLDGEHGWMMKFHDAGMNHVYVSLLRTSSGGRSWEKLFDPSSDGGVQSFAKTGMSFADSNVGWISRDPQGVQPGAFVDATTDGGRSWEQVDLPPPQGDPAKFEREACGTFDPMLFSPASGAVVVTCRRFDDGGQVTTHYLMRTSNAGRTWDVIDYPGGDLYFVDEDLGYALGREIHRSTDGGRSWTKIKDVSWDGQFSFVNGDTAWAVARSDEEIVLVMTSDGCRTFSEIKAQVVDPPAEYVAASTAPTSQPDQTALGGGTGEIAFISYRQSADPYVSEIYLTNMDGSELRKLTDGTGMITNFSWSPDGQQLVFDSDRDGDFEIYRIGVDGTGLSQLTSNDFADADPSWSPDGSRIAYVAPQGGADGIFLMNADGSDPQFLVEGVTPAWSPEGSTLAFARIEHGIYTIGADGSDLTRLTDSSGHGWDHHPVWSPDGNTILFASNRHQPGSAAAEAVYTMQADGTGIGQLTETWGSPPYAWSPDGRSIAYSEGFFSGASLHLMDAQGFNARPLIEDNGGFHPLWRP